MLLVLTLTVVGGTSAPAQPFIQSKGHLERAGPAPLSPPAGKIIKYDNRSPREYVIVELEGSEDNTCPLDAIKEMYYCKKCSAFPAKAIFNTKTGSFVGDNSVTDSHSKSAPEQCPDCRSPLARADACVRSYYIVKCAKTYSFSLPPLLKPAETAR